jgi:preprotein translocase subunit SecG
MYILVGLIIFICALLVLCVLAQNSKGGGLSSQFTGTSSNQLMGVKRTSDLLEQLTWGLAITLIILCLSTTFLLDTSSGGQVPNSINVDRAREKAVAPQGTLPTAPGNATPGTTTPGTTEQPGVTTPAPATTPTTPADSGQ